MNSDEKQFHGIDLEALKIVFTNNYTNNSIFAPYLNIFTCYILHYSRKQFRCIFPSGNHLKTQNETHLYYNTLLSSKIIILLQIACHYYGISISKLFKLLSMQNTGDNLQSQKPKECDIARFCRIIYFNLRKLYIAIGQICNIH